MNKYYYDLISQKLKKDIIFELSNEKYENIIKKEIEDYFQNYKLDFIESDKTIGTHQVRNRSAYERKENKCKALVWNEGTGGQCSRLMKEGCNGFCKQHFTKGGEEWWLGTIEKRVERPVDTKGKLHYWLEH
tara:strand:- start:37 stop:432 length:396 start_codon:yes stop_codon:yes gene_type:complete